MMASGCFLNREQIHLLVEDKISGKKFIQVQAHIRDCMECEIVYKNLNDAKSFLIDLSNLKATADTVTKLKSETKTLKNIMVLLQWRNLPPSLKWTMEYASIACVMFVGLHYFPWKRAVRKINTYRTLPQTIQIPLLETITLDLPLPTPSVLTGLEPEPPPMVGAAPVKLFQPKTVSRVVPRPTATPLPNYQDASDDIGTEVESSGDESVEPVGDYSKNGESRLNGEIKATENNNEPKPKSNLELNPEHGPAEKVESNAEPKLELKPPPKPGPKIDSKTSKIPEPGEMQEKGVEKEPVNVQKGDSEAIP